MANIIQITDFSGRFFLSENEYNSNMLQDIINEYTKKMLVDMLGIELYNDFYNDFQTGDGTPTQERWVNFLNGEIYTPSGFSTEYKFEYKGIKSFLIPLIYAKLMRDTSYTSDMGYVDGKTDGANQVTRIRQKNKADKAWNEGVQERFACYKYVYTNRDTYTDFELYYTHYDIKGTIKTETLI